MRSLAVMASVLGVLRGEGCKGVDVVATQQIAQAVAIHARGARDARDVQIHDQLNEEPLLHVGGARVADTPEVACGEGVSLE